MKRDIFHRGARFTFDGTGKGDDFDHFDPDYPRGMHFNTRGFTDQSDGYPLYPCPGGIKKPNGAQAERGKYQPESIFSLVFKRK